MKRHLGILLAGMALSSFASAQLLGIGAGLGVDAGVGVRALSNGAAQVLNHTAATVNGNVSAGVRSSVSAPPPAVYVESESRVEADAAVRAGSAYSSRAHTGSSVDLETRSSRRQAASPAGSPRPAARGARGATAQAEGWLDASGDARAASWEPPRERVIHATGGSDARVDVGARVDVPRLDLGVRSETHLRGAAAIR